MLNQVYGVSANDAWRVSRLAEFAGKTVIDADRLSGSVGNDWLREILPGLSMGRRGQANAHQKRTPDHFQIHAAPRQRHGLRGSENDPLLAKDLTMAD